MPWDFENLCSLCPLSSVHHVDEELAKQNCLTCEHQSFEGSHSQHSPPSLVFSTQGENRTRQRNVFPLGCTSPKKANSGDFGWFVGGSLTLSGSRCETECSLRQCAVWPGCREYADLSFTVLQCHGRYRVPQCHEYVISELTMGANLKAPINGATMWCQLKSWAKACMISLTWTAANK